MPKLTINCKYFSKMECWASNSHLSLLIAEGNDAHPYSLSGNGRGAIDPALALRVLGGHGSDLGGSGSTSRKRANPDVSSHNNHHHSAKSSRSSKGAGGSSHYSSDGGGGPRTVERHHGGPEGSNGVLGSNGQHTDYKDTFDMLDSLLSAQGMNL